MRLLTEWIKTFISYSFQLWIFQLADLTRIEEKYFTDDKNKTVKIFVRRIVKFIGDVLELLFKGS